MIATEAADLTYAWASAVFATPVRVAGCVPVGTGQIGTCYRLSLEAVGVPGSRDGCCATSSTAFTATDTMARGGAPAPSRDQSPPSSVLVKLPAVDPAARTMLAGAYATEVRFYAELAPTVAVRVPRCHLAGMGDDGAFTLVLEDLAPMVQGDQIAGCTPAQVRDAAVNLAGLHGPRWCDPALLDVEGLTLNGPDDAALLAELYGPATDLFVDGLGDLLDAETVATLRECVEATEAWALGRRERFGLVHGDYRLDNLMLPADGGAGSVALDWQTLSLALPARDLAYLVSTSLSSQDRRACERDVVEAYRAALLGHGVRDYAAELAWDDYRYAMLQGPLVSVFGCAYGTHTERGDRMFAAMVTRACTAIRDLGTLGLVGK